MVDKSKSPLPLLHAAIARNPKGAFSSIPMKKVRQKAIARALRKENHKRVRLKGIDDWYVRLTGKLTHRDKMGTKLAKRGASALRIARATRAFNAVREDLWTSL